jgi:hypothetical protein
MLFGRKLLTPQYVTMRLSFDRGLFKPAGNPALTGDFKDKGYPVGSGGVPGGNVPRNGDSIAPVPVVGVFGGAGNRL